ncbi:MAG: hypothetical protein U9N08_05785 [Candidatus Caldatribacteriota bacterium]|nr:hypothetical protein [Candidatus Caldatribacteriota bacterium]
MKRGSLYGKNTKDYFLERGEGIEGFLSSYFYEVMGIVYKKITFKKIGLNYLIIFYQNNWDKKFHDKVIIADDYQELEKQFIKNCYKYYYPFNLAKALVIERMTIINPEDNRIYRLRRHIDFLDQTKEKMDEKKYLR